MKRILVCSDLHCGSQYGLMPEVGVIENLITGESDELTPNKGQEYLLKRWHQMIDEVGKVDVCVINGDSCDGLQKKSDSLYLRTSSLDAQVDWAANLVKRIKAKTFYVTMGSKYHVGEQQPLDKMVAEKIGAKKFAGALLQTLQDEQIKIHYSHYVGGTKSTWQYGTTPIARDMVLTKLNDDPMRFGKVDIIVRSHIHWLVGAFYSRQRGIVTPGFQLITPFAIKKGLITPPDIGWVLIEVGDDGRIMLDYNAEYKQPVCVKTVD